MLRNFSLVNSFQHKPRRNPSNKLLTRSQCKGIFNTDINAFDKCNCRQVFDTITVKIKATKRDRVDAMWQ